MGCLDPQPQEGQPTLEIHEAYEMESNMTHHKTHFSIIILYNIPKYTFYPMGSILSFRPQLLRYLICFLRKLILLNSIKY